MAEGLPYRNGWSIKFTPDGSAGELWSHESPQKFKIVDTIECEWTNMHWGQYPWSNLKLTPSDPLFFTKLSKVLGFLQGQSKRHKKAEQEFWMAECDMYESLWKKTQV